MVKLIPCEIFIICIQIRSHIRNSNYCPFFLAFIVRKKREKEREEERGGEREGVRERERDREIDSFTQRQNSALWLLVKWSIIKPNF